MTRWPLYPLMCSVVGLTLVACGHVDGTHDVPEAGIDTGGEPPNAEGVALSADPLDLTTAVSIDWNPSVTLSARGTTTKIVPNYLREYVRSNVELVTYPELTPVPMSAQLTSDPGDRSLVVITVHPDRTLDRRWYAIKLPAIDGTKVPIDEQPEITNSLEVRFHPGTGARIRMVGVCTKSDGSTTLSINFSEAVLLDSGTDPNSAFVFSQLGGPSVTCKNTAVPVPGLAMDFEYRCTADRSKPLSISVNSGLSATADGPVNDGSVTLDFNAVRPTAAGCGIFVPSF